MKCKISSVTCVYHACMSDDCQKKEVLKTTYFGKGKCEYKIKNKQNNMAKKIQTVNVKEVKKLIKFYENKMSAYKKHLYKAIDKKDKKRITIMLQNRWNTHVFLFKLKKIINKDIVFTNYIIDLID